MYRERRFAPLTSPIMLLVFVILCLLAGRLSAYINAPAMVSWYPSLIKPAWTAPDEVFPFAWSFIFVLIGIAAWIVWKESARGQARGPLTWFFLQLGLTVLWSVGFFGLRSPFLGLVDIVLLTLVVVTTTLSFHRVSQIAGWLFLPYILWLGYAAALNFAIWRLNA